MTYNCYLRHAKLFKYIVRVDTGGIVSVSKLFNGYNPVETPCNGPDNLKEWHDYMCTEAAKAYGRVSSRKLADRQ